MDLVTDLTGDAPTGIYPIYSSETGGSDVDDKYPGSDGDMLLDDEEERKAIPKLVEAAQAGTAAAEGSSSKNPKSSPKKSGTEQGCHMQPVKLMLQAEAEARTKAFNARQLQAAKDKRTAGRKRARGQPKQSGKEPQTIEISSDDDDDIAPPRARRAKRAAKSLKPTYFRFLDLPAELRNKIYVLLLTHPDPIEMTRSRQTKGLQAEKFALAKTAKARSRIKSYFLEILQTNKQIHNEATMIMYGMNVFKFRSEPKTGLLNLTSFLPEKYLRNLRRVKISVMSSQAAGSEQDKWVAEMLNNTFSRDKITLETFELTWYAWKKIRLTVDGVLCQALLNMDVERVFTVHVKGDARMETAMLMELTSKVKARKMQIHRPVFEVVREGKKVELSDDE